jgi:hypothetical protein
MVGIFRNNFLSNYLSQPLDIWYTASTCSHIQWDMILGMWLIQLPFDDLVKFSALIVNGRKFP